jgi:hypothetical protein
MGSAFVFSPSSRPFAEILAGLGAAKYLRSGAQDKSRPGRSSVVVVFIGLDGFLTPVTAGLDDIRALHFKDLDASQLRQNGGLHDGRA